MGVGDGGMVQAVMLGMGSDRELQMKFLSLARPPLTSSVRPGLEYAFAGYISIFLFQAMSPRLPTAELQCCLFILYILFFF